LTDLTSSGMRRLYQSAYKRLREDAAADAGEIANREYQRLLDLEAVKILSQVTLIVNGSETACGKLEALCALLLSYDDDDEQASVTKVQIKPSTADENYEYLVGARRVKRN
jgi:hypothetical protein